MKHMLQIILCGILLFPVFSMAADRITGKAFATRSRVMARNGMAASSQPLVTQIALDILKQGGNAVDAAIAANAAQGLMEPTSNGMGGDIFVIVWDAKTRKLYGLNGSGRSPRSLTREYFIENGYTAIPAHGPLPVSVPGCVDGWFELHKKFGSMPMKKILAPAIEYARSGFPVTDLISHYWQMSASSLVKYPGFKETFMPAPKPGEIWKNPDLANTLENIADKGRDYFYKGPVARTIDTFMKKNGGFLSFRDMAEHHSEWVEPVSVNYRGYDIWELPPNGQGIATLQILQILEGFDLRSMGFGSAEYIHLFLEAKKLAFEDRAKFYADPDFNDIPVEALLSDTYAEKRRMLINPGRASRSLPHGSPLSDNGDTIYLTVADKHGNMVSLIQSNYRGIGSGMCPPGLGFGLQDRGELFTLKEGEYNTYEPCKRPFHTIIPAFITKDGRPFMSFGVMGGSTQPQGQAQIVINMIDFGMDVQEAGDAPRILHRGSSQPTGSVMKDGGIVSLEQGFDYECIRKLVGMGHRIQYNVGSFGGYQAIRVDAKRQVYFGASESRKDGQAAGY